MIAVGAGFADTGVAVNGDVAEMAVRRDGDFVAVDADFDAGDNGLRSKVEKQSGVFILVGNKEEAGRVEIWRVSRYGKD